MSPWELIPTCNDPMSCYTLCALTIITAAGFFALTVVVRWSSNEIRQVEKWVTHDLKKLESAINGHDEYIDDTTKVINQIRTDLEVQKSSLQDIKGDIAEIKSLIRSINNLLMEKK